MPRQLGQANPAALTDVEIYAPAAGLGARNLSLRCAETNGVASIITVFHDTNGAVRDDTTTIHETTVGANSTLVIPLNIEASDSSHGIGVESVSGNVTFTLYGDEFVA